MSPGMSTAELPCHTQPHTEIALGSESGMEHVTETPFEPQYIPTKSLYNDLNSDRKEIRVLEVDPGAGDDIVTCTLKHISPLDDPVPFYETISYCWGSPGLKTLLKLNGSMTLVPSTSEAAVRRMRFGDKPRVLWIDAICINQSSLSERSDQVALMSTIYSRASQNLVYLGEDNTAVAERAIENVRLVYTEMRIATNNFESLLEILYDQASEMRVVSNEDIQVDVDFAALESLFSLAWFTRLWVVQEASLSSISICHWGDAQIGLCDILRVAQWLYHRITHIPQGIRQSSGWFSAVILSEHVDPLLRNSVFRQKRPHDLHNFMHMSYHFKKTEPRDSVFAILGLMSVDKSCKAENVALLEVDYAKPLPEVLRDATRYALCQTACLQALTIVPRQTEQSKDNEGFTSWTARSDLDRGPLDPGMFPEFYCASKGLEQPYLLEDMRYGAQVLLIEGFVAGQVLHAVSLFAEDLYILQNFYTGLNRAKEIALRHCGPAFQNGSREGYIAIALTVTAGHTANLERAQPEDMVILGEYLASLDVDEAVPGSTNTARESKNVDTLGYIAKSHRCVNARGRQFFAMSEGSMGLGPKWMRRDDLVVILRGGDFPFILRKMGEFYQLIGPAYVYGIMDGEAVETWKAKNEPEIVFPIR